MTDMTEEENESISYIGTDKAEAAQELDELEAKLDTMCESLDAQLKLKGIDLSRTDFPLKTAFDTLMGMLFGDDPERQREFALRHMAVMGQEMQALLDGQSQLVTPEGGK